MDNLDIIINYGVWWIFGRFNEFMLCNVYYLIYSLFSQMSRQWMYNADRRSMEFINGVHEFIDVAKKHKCGGFFRCPCQLCKNEKDYSSTGTIHSHLFRNGFMPNYNVSTEHGERGIILEDGE